MPRNFGWGIAQSGHNFVIGSVADPLFVIPAALLGHLGKHGPILLVARDQVPKEVADYLEMVKPYASGPRQTIRNHAWIIGDESRLAWEVQKQIIQLLSPRREATQTPPMQSRNQSAAAAPAQEENHGQ